MEANPDVVEYRVVLVDPASRRVLGQAGGSTFRVLRVSIPVRARVARHLGTEMLRKWGIRVVILDFLSTGEDGDPCVVAELLTTISPLHFSAASADEVPNDELSDHERMHLQRVLGNNVTSPFSRIGWMEEAITWIERATGRRLCSEGGVEQHNAGGPFALLRLRMEDGSKYWLKATGAPNTHERQMTSSLSTLCPPCLPNIVAEKPEWNAWLMTGEAYCLTSLPTDPDDLLRLLGQAAKSLAELQIETVGRESLLFAAGAFDQRLDVVRVNANGLFAFVAEAMSLQTSTKVPRIAAGRLKEIREIFERLCDHVQPLNIPSTILHGDMNLGNLLFTEERCQLIDWCEGYVGHPLVTFQHLLLLNPIEDLAVKAWVTDALKEIYFAAMSTICDPRNLREGFTWMAFLAAASVLYGRGNWPLADLRGDSARLGYARSIARQMDRSAREPAFMKALCC
jgi:hypothetical protein